MMQTLLLLLFLLCRWRNWGLEGLINLLREYGREVGAPVSNLALWTPKFQHFPTPIPGEDGSPMGLFQGQNQVMFGEHRNAGHHSFLQAFKERSPNTYCVLVSVFTDTVVNNTSNALRELIFFWNRQKITIKCYQCHEFSMEAYRIVTHVGISCVISDTSLD